MYKINFLDEQKNIIATHYIGGDNSLPTMSNVERYCLQLSKSYPLIKSWVIFKYIYQMHIGGVVL